MHLEHHKKKHLRQVLDGLKEWHSNEFCPRMEAAKIVKEEKDQARAQECDKNGAHFAPEAFDKFKHMELSEEEVIKLDFAVDLEITYELDDGEFINFDASNLYIADASSGIEVDVEENTPDYY